jgi:hypothetical protein
VQRRAFMRTSFGISALAMVGGRFGWGFGSGVERLTAKDYQFNKTIARPVLERYLSRAITMEGLVSGRGNFADNIRMLRDLEAKFIGRSICLWGGEAKLLQNLEAARRQFPQVRAIGEEVIFEACIFEIVTRQVEEIPVPAWAFVALKQPVETRNFRYAEMLYPQGTRVNQFGEGASVPDVSRMETKLWFYFLAASYIDIGFEAIHFGQVEIMNGNDPDLSHWSHLFELVRAYASQHARRGMVLCNGHVPSGGLVRNGVLLLDFHAFPLRIMEVPGKPEEAILQAGFADSIYGRSKGGVTFSGWTCQHLPYLVEFDNYGVSKEPGVAGLRSFWVWGYDEISWFAHQSASYRASWLRYAAHWVRSTDPNGFLEMPGGRTVTSPLDHRSWYSANVPSPAVPDGLGDEVAIRAIWGPA